MFQKCDRPEAESVYPDAHQSVHLPASIGMADESADLLHKIIDELTTRMSPVLRPLPAADREKEFAVNAPGCQLTCAARHVNGKILKAQQRLAEIISVLDV